MADVNILPMILSADRMDELLKPARKFSTDWIEAGLDLELGALLLEYEAAFLRVGVSFSMNLMARLVVGLDETPRENARRPDDEVRTTLANCLGALGRKPTRRALMEFISKSKSQVETQSNVLSMLSDDKIDDLVRALAPIAAAIEQRTRDLRSKKKGVAEHQQPLP